MREFSKYSIYFAGGFAAGILLSIAAKKLTQTATGGMLLVSLRRAPDVSRRLAHSGGRYFSTVSQKIKKETSMPIPELYKATENLEIGHNDFNFN